MMTYIFIQHSVQIYEQVMSVIRHLYCISAVRVVGLICDGASEHSKFFRMVLDGVSTQDRTRPIFLHHPCDKNTKIFAIPDIPHITKKGRGSLFRSGDNSWSTRRMLYGKEGDTIHDGDLMTWDPIVWIHENRNKKNEAGQERCKCYYIYYRTVFILFFYYIFMFVHIVFRRCRKMTDSVVYPTSLELLRVKLAAAIFSPAVRDLINVYKDDISRALHIADLDPLNTYLNHFWELLQLNNSVRVCSSSSTCLSLICVYVCMCS